MTKAFTAAALAIALLPAQSQPPTFKARADLVQVDVVVVDRDGTPVRGLRAYDFVLRDRGRPQSIASFDEVSRAVAAAANSAAVPLSVKVTKDVADNQSVQADRLVVMVLDDLHIYRERTDRAKEIARQVVRDLGPASSMSVLFTSSHHSTQVTDDLSVLSAAVETLQGRQSWRRPHPAIDDQTGPRIDPGMSVDQLLAVLQRKQDASMQDFSDNMTQYKLLRDAARMLGSGDGRRKAFVLVSEGIGKNLSGLFGAMRPPGDVPQGGAEYAAGDVEATAIVAPEGYHDNAVIDMMESMRRANVATYAIDPRGRVESKDLARECFPAPHPDDDPCSQGLTDWASLVRQAQHGLEFMSEASGGFAVTNTDDFTSGLARIVGDLDHYYLLGFYPPDPKGKGYRPLDVRVPGRPELRLRFRRGYLPGGPPPPPKNKNDMVALSAGVLPKTDLPLRLEAIAMPAARGNGTASVVLLLQVAARRSSLEEKDGRLHDTLKYEVLVVDEKKARVRSMAGVEAVLTLSGNAAAGPAPDVAVYQVADAVEIPRGRYEFRVSAASAKLAAGGSVYLGVDVPDFRSAPALGGLAIGYLDGARVPVAPRRVSPAQRGARPPAADMRRSLPFAPTLDRAFAASDTLRAYVEGVVDSGVRPAVSVDVVDAAGKVVRSPSPSFSTGDVVRIESTIPLAGLPPGPYLLRATLAGSGRAPAVRDSAFVIR